MVLASSCCENEFACSTQPRNPQGRLLQVETEKTLANLAIKYDLCQQQQLNNCSHELYERMAVVLSHVRRLKNPVLRATLTQLGTKPVKLEKSFKVIDDRVVTCHITALQSDLAQTDVAWTAIPAKAILARLSQTTVRDSIRSVWGRSYRNAKGACKVQEATSIRIWLHVGEAAFETLLRDSGFCRLNILPHDSKGLPHHELSMLWVCETREEVESRLQILLSHLGAAFRKDVAGTSPQRRMPASDFHFPLVQATCTPSCHHGRWA